MFGAPTIMLGAPSIILELVTKKPKVKAQTKSRFGCVIGLVGFSACCMETNCYGIPHTLHALKRLFLKQRNDGGMHIDNKS